MPIKFVSAALWQQRNPRALSRAEPAAPRRRRLSLKIHAKIAISESLQNSRTHPHQACVDAMKSSALCYCERVTRSRRKSSQAAMFDYELL